jgi:DNA-binding MarR family transcriptional regulator
MSYVTQSNPNDATRDSDHELPAAITAFFRALESSRSRDALEVQLTATEYRALARVVEVGSKTPKRLAISMGMSTGAITAIADRLVARGLLERVANEADGRSVVLQPTPAGRELVGRLFGNYTRVIGDAVRDLSDDDVQQLTVVLRNLTASLDATN